MDSNLERSYTIRTILLFVEEHWMIKLCENIKTGKTLGLYSNLFLEPTLSRASPLKLKFPQATLTAQRRSNWNSIPYLDLLISDWNLFYMNPFNSQGYCKGPRGKEVMTSVGWQLLTRPSAPMSIRRFAYQHVCRHSDYRYPNFAESTI